MGPGPLVLGLGPCPMVPGPGPLSNSPGPLSIGPGRALALLSIGPRPTKREKGRKKKEVPKERTKKERAKSRAWSAPTGAEGNRGKDPDALLPFRFLHEEYKAGHVAETKTKAFGHKKIRQLSTLSVAAAVVIAIGPI